jgi:hypothetical protein
MRPQVEDGAAGLVVLEQRRLRGGGEQGRGGERRGQRGTLDGFHR